MRIYLPLALALLTISPPFLDVPSLCQAPSNSNKVVTDISGAWREEVNTLNKLERLLPTLNQEGCYYIAHPLYSLKKRVG